MRIAENALIGVTLGCSGYNPGQNGPTKKIVVNTWPYAEANEAAWNVLKNGGSALDAITAGTSRCEELQCDYEGQAVGWGNNPDSDGEVTLDAMIMDGQTGNVGAVGGLRRVKHAAKVARHVLDNTRHSLLVGDMATEFALEMGYEEESLSSPSTEKEQSDWLANSCQPNYWMNVVPDSTLQCGPYQSIESPLSGDFGTSSNDVFGDDYFQIGEQNHDTIGMVAIDQFGHSASGTSTNGLLHKIHGRVGDSPIAGAGSYVNKYGACAATGNGDIMMRFSPCYQAVENMRLGMNPRQAALNALQRIVSKYDYFVGALITISPDGDFSAACHNIDDFPYVVTTDTQPTQTMRMKCSTTKEEFMTMLNDAGRRWPWFN